MSTTRRTVARVILALCAAAAAGAAIGAWSLVDAAAPTSAMAEGWRMIGFATFAVLFALLAAAPSKSLGLWLAVLANKAVLTASAATFLSSAVGAGEAMAWDGTLTVLLLVAFVLARPWKRERAVAHTAARLEAVAA